MLMATSMKDNGRTVLEMASAKSHITMMMYILVNGKTINKHMAKWNTSMAAFIRAAGTKGKGGKAKWSTCCRSLSKRR